MYELNIADIQEIVADYGTDYGVDENFVCDVAELVNSMSEGKIVSQEDYKDLVIYCVSTYSSIQDRIKEAITSEEQDELDMSLEDIVEKCLISYYKDKSIGEFDDDQHIK